MMARGFDTSSSSTGQTHRALIIGASEIARKVAAELSLNTVHGLAPVGFVTSEETDGGRPDTLPVLGRLGDLIKIARSFDIDHVVVILPSSSSVNLREIKSLCQQAQLVLRVAAVNGLHGNGAFHCEIRPVQIEDLLRNGPVEANHEGLRQRIEGRRVLVTGAGGSIGSELCRQIAQYGPAQLALLGHGEHSIFTLASELNRIFPRQPIARIIADVRDHLRLEKIFSDLRPEVVLHAAAHKHVPLMEENVEEAITNNVLGTRNLVNAALAIDVNTFTLISTDKAVNPTSVMGATKRVAEIIVSEAARNTSRCFVSVRFGNVLGSRGSVLSIFRDQMRHGGPLTVTHPEMRRYFMTIDEAVHLALQAIVLGKGGEIFVLDMGEPRLILDIARDLIEFHRFEVDREIAIEFTGARPGEKLSEELALQSNDYLRSANSKIYILRSSINGQSHAEHNVADRPMRLTEQVAELIEAARVGDQTRIFNYLGSIVTEYNRAALSAVHTA
jgi:FlaA1/EpsC-like NDP-sugar epimerase